MRIAAVCRIVCEIQPTHTQHTTRINVIMHTKANVRIQGMSVEKYDFIRLRLFGRTFKKVMNDSQQKTNNSIDQ